MCDPMAQDRSPQQGKGLQKFVTDTLVQVFRLSLLFTSLGLHFRSPGRLRGRAEMCPPRDVPEIGHRSALFLCTPALLSRSDPPSF